MAKRIGGARAAAGLAFVLLLAAAAGCGSNAAKPPAAQGDIGPVVGVAFAPGGTLLAAAKNERVKMWDPETGAEKAPLSGHAGALSCLRISADGKVLATGSYDKTIKLCDLAGGKELRTLEGHTAQIVAIALSPDAKLLASGAGIGEGSPGGKTTELKLWDAETGKLLADLKGHPGVLTCVAFSPDGKTLASGAREGAVKLWDVQKRESVASLPFNTWPTAVAFSADGKSLAVATFGDGIHVVETSGWKPTVKLTSADQRPVTDVQFSRDGKTLASGGDDRLVTLWPAAGGEPKKTFAGHTGYVNAIAFGADDKTLASGSQDGTVRIWDVDQGKEKLSLR